MSKTKTDVVLQEKITVKTALPSMFKVILLNDDVTPIQFVVDILMDIFKHSVDEATAITMQVHSNGSGVAGIYTFEIAEQKAQEAITFSRKSGFPLQLTIEQE